MKNRIWLVEMWNFKRESWEPTVGAGLTKEEALYEASEWRRKNPDDRFRVKKYVTVKAK